MCFGKFCFSIISHVIFFLNRYIFKKKIKIIQELKQYYKKIIKSPGKTRKE
jgi:hypothetical protein